SVRYRANAFGRPYPAAFAIRPTLPKILRLEADDLKQELAALVAVVISRNDLLRGAAFIPVNVNAKFLAKPAGNFIGRNAAFVVDQFDRAAADRTLVIIPLAAIGTGYLH